MSRRRKDSAKPARPVRESHDDKRSWFDHLLFWRTKKTAQTAKLRLMALLETERAQRGGARLPE